MTEISRLLLIAAISATLLGACAQRAPAPIPLERSVEPAYVAPQSAPVRSPTYPSLGGPVLQMDTASIPLVQGK